MSGLAEAVKVQPAQVVTVYDVRLGAILASTLAPSGSTITVDDADPFVDQGGMLSLAAQDDVLVPADGAAGTVAFYDLRGSEGVRYTDVDRDTNVIGLEAAWDTTFPTFTAGDSVWVEPPVMTRRADVALDGDAEQVVAARVPYALAPSVPPGVRLPEAGEWVQVAVTDTGYELVDMVGESPLVDADSVGTVEGEASAQYDLLTAAAIASPTVPVRNPNDRILYVDASSGDDDNGGEALAPLIDAFERTVAGAFGTADSGHPWTQMVHTGSVLSVSSGAGRLGCGGPSQKTIQVSDFRAYDNEVLALVNINALPSAGGFLGGVSGRAVDSATVLAAELQVTSVGVVTLQVEEQLASTWTSIGSSASLGTFSGATLAATDWWIRCQTQASDEGGTVVRAKAWKSTDAEPEAWTIEVNTATSSGLQSPSRVALLARTGAAFTGSVQMAFREVTGQVLDSGGVVVDVTDVGVGPLATLGSALARVGDWNDGAVTIILAGEVAEDLDLAGLGGGGTLVIDGARTAVLGGFIRLRNVAHDVTIRALIVQDAGTPGPTSSIDIRASGYVALNGVSLQGNGYRSNGIAFNLGSRGRVEDCELHGATARQLYSVNGSVIYATDNRGSGVAEAYRAACGIIFVNGTKPSNANAQTLGGQIFGTTASNNAGSAPTPRPTRKTDTVSANATRTWRPQWGYRTDNDEAYQGEWQGSGGLSRGAAFYGTKLRKAGKTAVSGKIFVRRLGSGGPGGRQAIFLAVHPEEKQGGGGPGITLAPTRIGELANGQGAWLTIPKSYLQSVMTGPGRGFMLYHDSPSPYVIAVGRNGGQSNFQVKMTYE